MLEKLYDLEDEYNTLIFGGELQTLVRTQVVRASDMRCLRHLHLTLAHATQSVT
jgi:hypothetical protein